MTKLRAKTKAVAPPAAKLIKAASAATKKAETPVKKLMAVVEPAQATHQVIASADLIKQSADQPVLAKTASPKTAGGQTAAGTTVAPAVEKKLAEVSLNKTTPEVITAVPPSASPAESVAAAIKKAAEKIMIGKAAMKASVTQPTETKLQEPKPDSKSILAKAPEVKPAAKPAPKPASSGRQFKVTEFIVYPAHGVGQILAVEEQEVAGFKLELFVISFIKDKMILKVPTTKVASVGMRKLAESDVVKKALDTLTGRARIKRTMWSRRAQEYEAKINSGDLGAIAEVVRDLYRSDAQPEQSYSERQLYEAALERLSREVGTVQKLTDTESLKLIETQLQKGPRRSKADEAEADSPDAEEGEIEEAA